MLARVLCLALAWTAAVAAAPAPKDEPKLDKATLAKIRKLQIEQRDALKKEVQARQEEVRAGRATAAVVFDASRRLLKAELDLAATAKDRLAAHEAHLKVARQVEKFSTAGYKAGLVTTADYHKARAAVLEAEIGWLKAGGKEKKDSKEKK